MVNFWKLPKYPAFSSSYVGHFDYFRCRMPRVLFVTVYSVGSLSRVGKAIYLDPEGVNPREAQKISKPFWILLDHVISSVHSTRWTRVISSWSIVIPRELCQVSWLWITLAGKARTKAGNDPVYHIWYAIFNRKFFMQCKYFVINKWC